jgi:nicotinate phosphoribosyltransferase
MKDGKICVPIRPLSEIQQYAKESLASFHKSYRRLINPHIYKVSLSKRLKQLKRDLILEAKGIPR